MLEEHSNSHTSACVFTCRLLLRGALAIAPCVSALPALKGRSPSAAQQTLQRLYCAKGAPAATSCPALCMKSFSAVQCPTSMQLHLDHFLEETEEHCHTCHTGSL